jgi:hypothetical protein
LIFEYDSIYDTDAIPEVYSVSIKSCIRSRFWAAVLTIILLIPAQGEAQEGGLRLTVVEGDGSVNNIRAGTAKEPVVKVEDAAGKPVPGVTVTFMMPELGAGGTFTGGLTTLVVQSGEDGQAVGRGLRPNNVAGEFQIRVIASQGGERATATISQSNVLPSRPKSSNTKWIAILAVAGGAAAAGIAVGGGGNNDQRAPVGIPTVPTVSTVLTPGIPTFGPRP